MNQEVVRSCTSRTRVGCYSKLHMIFMGKALEIIQLVIDHDTIFCVKCIFFFLLLQEAIQVDGDVLFGLLKKTQPSVYKHIVSYVN